MEWMWDKEKLCEEVDSDLENISHRRLSVRNRNVRVREKLGLIKKVESEGKEYWAILERNEL